MDALGYVNMGNPGVLISLLRNDGSNNWILEDIGYVSNYTRVNVADLTSSGHMAVVSMTYGELKVFVFDGANWNVNTQNIGSTIYDLNFADLNNDGAIDFKEI